MKHEETSARPKHLQEHEPTVIHHPEEDETLLARWLRQAMASGPLFWLGLLGIAGLIVALRLGSLYWATAESADSATWKQLILARDPAQRAELGEKDNGPAGQWALLQSAEQRYMDGFQDLPQNREAALEDLKAAYDLFKQAHLKAPAGSQAKYLAAMGMARTLEARGDVDAAVEQYDAIAKTWAKSDLGARAEKLAAVLRQPESREFYKEFGTFKPAPAVLPPGGSSPLNLGLPGLSGSPLQAPPPGSPALTPPADTAKESELPVDLSKPASTEPAKASEPATPGTPEAAPAERPRPRGPNRPRRPSRRRSEAVEAA